MKFLFLVSVLSFTLICSASTINHVDIDTARQYMIGEDGTVVWLPTK